MQPRAGHDREPRSSAPPVPPELGEYRLLEKLGEGGMGAVYRAVHTRLDKLVAVKLLREADQTDELAIDRFEREMKAVGQLNHPNLIQAYDARVIDGTRFLVTEYVEGVNLEELLQRGGRLPVAEACEICRQAALGLQAIHEHGVVHRDIKPSNVMVTYQGLVKVLDLGLARTRPAAAGGTLTVTGQVMGTPDYMAPEQASDCHAIDIRADLYSLGCTLYELLTGEVVFGGPQFKSFFDKVAAHLMRPARPIQELRSELPGSLAGIVHRMLAKEPRGRFATPAEVVEALTSFSAGGDLKSWLHRSGIHATIYTAPAPTPPASELSLPSQTDLAHQILAAADRTPPQTAVQPDGSSGRPGSRALRLPRPASRRSQMVFALLGIAVAMAGIWALIPETPPHPEELTQPSTNRVTLRNPKEPATTPPAEPQPQPTAPQPTTTSTTPAEPPLAVAPFDDTQAKRYQERWAAYLGEPVDQTNSVGMKLVLVPPGEFEMGSPDEPGTASSTSGERPSHRVRINRPFLLGVYEVTQAEFQKLLGSNPSRFQRMSNAKGDSTEPDAERRPVESVSWTAAVEFCHKLSTLPAEASAGRVYRLPREAEWEYACRAGSTTRWSSGDEATLAEYAWFGYPEGKPAPVGQQKPNPWGLYDMHGNVFEWCADWFAADYYRSSPSDDPAGPATGLERVIRGGSWWTSAANHCRSAARASAPLEGGETVGFRVLCELHQKAGGDAGTPTNGGE